MKLINFIKTNLKYILPTVGILIIIVVGIFYFVKTDKSHNTTDNKTVFINFANNYQFEIPENFGVSVDRHQGETTILMNKDIEYYNPNVYIEILNKNGIVIQSFPTFNKNDEFFEKYVKEKYQSSVADVDINFEQVKGNKVALVNIYNKTTQVTEFIKIVNLVHPVIIAASGTSEALSAVVGSIKNIDEKDDKLEEIKNQVMALASLMQANMTTEIYSLFTEDLKKQMNETDFKSIFRNSQEIMQKQMSFNGGTLDNKAKEFEGRVIFIDPENKDKFLYAKFGLKKEKNKWLIFKLELPKDKKEKSPEGKTQNETNLPAAVTQEQIDKALEQSQ